MRMFKKQLIALMLIICLGFSEFATIISCSIDTEGEIETETVLFANDYKSKLYENYYSGKRNEFKYTLEHEIEINAIEESSGINLKEEPDKFLLGEEQINLEPYMYYNFALVSVKSFNEIFGEAGKLEFYNTDDELIGGISADMNKPDDEFYIYNFEEEYSQITYKITSPISSGNLEMKIQKSIKPEIVDDLEYEEFRDIKQLVNNINLSYIKEETENENEENVEEIEVEVDEKVIEEKNIETIMDLKEPVTKAELTLSTNTLNALEENKVNFNITLKNSYYENELFENPTVEIELPEEIESVKIDRIMLLYRNGLSLANWYVVEEDDKKFIEIELKGKQEEYQNSEIIDGTNIVLSTTIKVKDTTSIKDSELKLRYTNSDKEITYADELDYDSYEIEFMSRYGLLTVSEVKNASNEEMNAISIGETINSMNLDMDSEVQTLDFDMTIVNNYTKCLENVEIIGCFPVENNEKLESKDLKNTYSMNVLTTIGTIGVENKVYYSDEINPESDSESWTENIEELEQINSYKIEIGNLEPEQYLKFNYQAEVPENLSYNESSYSYYEVNYDYKEYRDSVESLVGAETERKDVVYKDCQIREETELLNIGVYASKGGKLLEDGQNVHEGQIIDYYVVLENKTDEPIENVEVDTILNNADFYELRTLEQDEYADAYTDVDYYVYSKIEDKNIDQKNINIGAGEKIELRTQAVIKENITNDDNEIFADVNVKYNDQEFPMKSIINTIIPSKMNIQIGMYGTENIELSSSSIYRMDVQIFNNSIEDFEKTKFELIIPKDCDYNKCSESLSYIPYSVVEARETEDKKIYTMEIDNVEIGTGVSLMLMIDLPELDREIEYEEKEFDVVGYYEDEAFYSNHYIKNVYQNYTELKTELKSNKTTGDVISDGEEIAYDLDITNIGILEATVDATMYIPEGLIVNNFEVYKNDEFIEDKEIDNSKIEYFSNIDKNDVIKIKFVGKASKDLYEDGQSNLELSAKVSSLNVLENVEISNKIDIDEQDIIYEDEFIDDSELYFNDSNEFIEDEIQENFEESWVDTEELDVITEKLFDFNKAISKDKELSSETVKIDEEKNFSQSLIQDELNKLIALESVKTSNNRGSISGNVWLDENGNGLCENNENGVSNIIVKLYKTSDEISSLKGDLYSTITDNQGNYEFTNIEDGDYVVLFDYDNNCYDLSTYLANSNKDNNSKAIKKTISNKEYGITNIVTIKKSKESNVNLGLIKNLSFDLDLKTSISSMSIKNDKYNEVLTYKNEKAVKENLSSKYLNGAEINIKYDIKITNIGDVPGYVNEIYDYLPEGLEFNEKLNNNWYLSEEKLVNNSLSNIEIKPNETKELELILSKKLTKGNIGEFENVITLGETSNSKNISDYNPENNQDSAKIILGTKKINYIIYIISCVIIIGFIVLVIYKKKIKK